MSELRLALDQNDRDLLSAAAALQRREERFQLSKSTAVRECMVKICLRFGVVPKGDQYFCSTNGSWIVVSTPAVVG